MGKQTERFARAEHQLWQSVGVAPEVRHVRLRTGEMVRVQETGEGPPVLLIHGAANAGTSWMSLMAAPPTSDASRWTAPAAG